MSARANKPETKPAAPEPGAPALSPAVLWTLIGTGFALRIVLAGISWGTTDTISFLHFALRIDAHGLIGTYRIDPLFNHPPIAGYWSYLAFVLAGRPELLEHDTVFAFVFRLPVIAADFASAMLVWRIALAHGAGTRTALTMAAMYAWNPCAILVTGYHGNTDAVYAMLSLLAVYLLQDRNRPFLGGLALGLAINIKLIPVLLIPPLALAARSRRELLLFIAGLAVMALPYLPPLLTEPAFARNVLAYKSQPDPWGILFFLRQIDPAGVNADGTLAPGHAATVYNRWGSWIILGCVTVWGVVARRYNERFDRYRVAAVTYALFLVLAPGFGIQYLIVLAPLLYATAPRFANLYGVLAGVFMLAAYFFYWDGLFPLSSLFDRAFPTPLALFGLMPWCVLLYFLVAVAPRARDAGSIALRYAPATLAITSASTAAGSSRRSK